MAAPAGGKHRKTKLLRNSEIHTMQLYTNKPHHWESATMGSLAPTSNSWHYCAHDSTSSRYIERNQCIDTPSTTSSYAHFKRKCCTKRTLVHKLAVYPKMHPHAQQMSHPPTRIANQIQRIRRWITHPNPHTVNATGVVSHSAAKTAVRAAPRRGMNAAAATVRCHQTFSRQTPTHVMHATENTGRRADDSATCWLRLATGR